MKICLACESTFELATWTCPHCHWTPPIIEGFTAFSPELAKHNDGLPDEVHHSLNTLQEKSFWFRGRNQLIQMVIQRYFPHAAHVLEIGCGSGYVLSGIRDVLPDAHLTATEIYSYGLSYAARRIRAPHQFLQLDARQLPFKEEFDLIGAFDVLEHIEEDTKVIENMRASLKPKGGLLITVPQHPWLWSKADELAYHKRRYTRHQLRTLLQQHDFHILLDTSFMFFLLPLMLAQRFLATRKPNYHQTQELALPKIIDKTFELLFAGERRAIQSGIRFPIGGSRLVVAQR
jgi:SAM-dependent methyltransferase